MRVIELTKGQAAIVDDEDFDKLAQWRWSLNRNGYAHRVVRDESGKRSAILMHRIIIGAKNGELVDHINMIRTDNRRCNLRLATRSQNRTNSKTCRTNLLGIKGVKMVTTRRGVVQYVAQIRHGGKTRHLGTFSNQAEAHSAYCSAATEAFGEFARFN